MNRYCDMDKFAQAICEDMTLTEEEANKFIHLLWGQSVADVAEVQHGEWQQNPHCKRIYYCSECGRHIEDGTNNPNEHFPYCHCGARMGQPQNPNTSTTFKTNF